MIVRVTGGLDNDAGDLSGADRSSGQRKLKNRVKTVYQSQIYPYIHPNHVTVIQSPSSLSPSLHPSRFVIHPWSDFWYYFKLYDSLKKYSSFAWTKFEFQFRLNEFRIGLDSNFGHNIYIYIYLCRLFNTTDVFFSTTKHYLFFCHSAVL